MQPDCQKLTTEKQLNEYKVTSITLKQALIIRAHLQAGNISRRLKIY
jgi:hypothetical protein